MLLKKGQLGGILLRKKEQSGGISLRKKEQSGRISLRKKEQSGGISLCKRTFQVGYESDPVFTIQGSHQDNVASSENQSDLWKYCGSKVVSLKNCPLSPSPPPFFLVEIRIPEGGLYTIAE